MRIQTLIQKYFHKNAITDLMDVKDEDDKAVEYFSIDASEDDSEPSYFVRKFEDGLYQVTNLTGKVLLSTYNETYIKTLLKVLAP